MRQILLDLSKISLTVGSAIFGVLALWQHFHGNDGLALWYMAMAIWLEPKT